MERRIPETSLLSSRFFISLGMTSNYTELKPFYCSTKRKKALRYPGTPCNRSGQELFPAFPILTTTALGTGAVIDGIPAVQFRMRRLVIEVLLPGTGLMVTRGLAEMDGRALGVSGVRKHVPKNRPFLPHTAIRTRELDRRMRLGRSGDTVRPSPLHEFRDGKRRCRSLIQLCPSRFRRHGSLVPDIRDNGVSGRRSFFPPTEPILTDTELWRQYGLPIPIHYSLLAENPHDFRFSRKKRVGAIEKEPQ